VLRKETDLSGHGLNDTVLLAWLAVLRTAMSGESAPEAQKNFNSVRCALPTSKSTVSYQCIVQYSTYGAVQYPAPTRQE